MAISLKNSRNDHDRLTHAGGRNSVVVPGAVVTAVAHMDPASRRATPGSDRDGIYEGDFRKHIKGMGKRDNGEHGRTDISIPADCWK